MADTYSRRLDQLRTLLREAAGRPVSYSELLGRGIDNPAQAVYELELEGEELVHVAGGVALPFGRSSPMESLRPRR